MKSEFIKNEAYSFIFSAMKYENALIMRTCLETGLRVGDVCALPREALQGQTIHFKAQKTGKSGSVQISADLANRLRKEYGKWLFPSPRNLSKHRTRQAVWRDMRLACSKLGIAEHVSPHSARKTFAVDLYREKGLQAVQRALQHDRAETTKIYAFSDKNVENLVENFDFEAFAELVAEKVYKKIKGIA